jgi:hypothetical protein
VGPKLTGETVRLVTELGSIVDPHTRCWRDESSQVDFFSKANQYSKQYWLPNTK